MFFDSHVHLTDPRFAGDTAAVVERARAAGVDAMTLIASDAVDALAALDLAREHDLWSTAGIHPHQADRVRAGFHGVRELAGEPGIVAIGETGLDYYYDNAPRQTQRDAFHRHLALAAETGLPVVVHSRDADDDTIAMIRAAGDITGVLHCFAGGTALFEAGVEAGWYVSFSGLVTFPSYDAHDLVAATPPDRLMIETDAPYLAPVPYRGRRNEPAYVIEVARAVASLLGARIEEIAARTSRNARAFYRLDD